MGKFSKEKESLIVKMYKDGYSQKDIAEYFGTFNTSIRRVLVRNNITIRSNSRVQRLCKHNPFKRNDEMSDYFLGLLLTDGTISTNVTKSSNSICLALHERDGYIVEQFRDWVSPDLKLQRVHQKLNNSYMNAVTFVSRDTEEWLKRKGNFNNKSYECKIYTPINWNILRGIFDGDGGFHPNSNHLDFFICGKSLVFMNQIKRFLEEQGFTTYIRERRNGNNVSLYYVEIYRIKDVLLLGELMYKDAHIFIRRKYDKWLSFYESRSCKDTLNSGDMMASQS